MNRKPFFITLIGFLVIWFSVPLPLLAQVTGPCFQSGGESFDPKSPLIQGTKTLKMPTWNVAKPGVWLTDYLTSKISIPTASATFTLGVALSGMKHVLLPSGKILLYPAVGANPAFKTFDPVTGVLTTGVSQVAPSLSLYGFGSLMSNGKVLLGPQGNPSLACYRIYNPADDTLATGAAIPDGVNSMWDAILTPNGNTVAMGYTSPHTYYPNTNTAANGPSTGHNGSFKKMILLANGSYLILPKNGAPGHACVYNHVTNTITSFPACTSASGFETGCLLPSGNVLLVPLASEVFQIYNPITGTIDPTTVSSNRGANAFSSALLLPSGQVCLTPRYTTSGRLGFYNTDGSFSEGPYCVAGGNSYLTSSVLPDGRVFMCPYGAAKIGWYNNFGGSRALEDCLHPAYH